VIEIRGALESDADAMAEVQNAIHRAGLRATAVDPYTIRDRYLDEPHSIACTVAAREDVVVGFQSIKRAWEGNPYDVPAGWGIIGTHIHPDVGRQGLGRRLWAVTRSAVAEAGIRHIDASIGATNAPGLAYYSAIGFIPYRREQEADAIPHRYDM
jgi:GNAT superfamily N-acetyltransferase